MLIFGGVFQVFFFEGCFQGGRIFTQQKWRDWKMDLSFYSMFVLEGCCFGIRGFFWRRNDCNILVFRFGMASFKRLPWFWRVLNRFHPPQKEPHSSSSFVRQHGSTAGMPKSTGNRGRCRGFQHGLDGSNIRHRIQHGVIFSICQFLTWRLKSSEMLDHVAGNKMIKQRSLSVLQLKIVHSPS